MCLEIAGTYFLIIGYGRKSLFFSIVIISQKATISIGNNHQLYFLGHCQKFCYNLIKSVLQYKYIFTLLVIINLYRYRKGKAKLDGTGATLSVSKASTSLSLAAYQAFQIRHYQYSGFKTHYQSWNKRYSISFCSVSFPNLLLTAGISDQTCKVEHNLLDKTLIQQR